MPNNRPFPWHFRSKRKRIVPSSAPPQAIKMTGVSYSCHFYHSRRICRKKSVMFSPKIHLSPGKTHFPLDKPFAQDYSMDNFTKEMRLSRTSSRKKSFRELPGGARQQSYSGEIPSASSVLNLTVGTTGATVTSLRLLSLSRLRLQGRGKSRVVPRYSDRPCFGDDFCFLQTCRWVRSLIRCMPQGLHEAEW